MRLKTRRLRLFAALVSTAYPVCHVADPSTAPSASVPPGERGRTYCAASFGFGLLNGLQRELGNLTLCGPAPKS
jgi:hypothetical protein